MSDSAWRTAFAPIASEIGMPIPEIDDGAAAFGEHIANAFRRREDATAALREACAAFGLASTGTTADMRHALARHAIEVQEKLASAPKKRARKPAEPKPPREPKPPKPPPPMASDEELDGPHGDPTVRFPLREAYWPQPDPHADRRFSECPADYLDQMAKSQEASAWWQGKQGNETGKAHRKADAAKARGWAARIRARGASFATADEVANFADGEPPPFAPSDFEVDDEIPF